VQAFLGLPGERVRVVPWASSALFRPPAGPEPAAAPARPFFLYVGDRTHYKNFAALLRAFAALSQRYGVALVVVGPPAWSAEEAALIAALQISDRVGLAGQPDDRALCELYNRAAAFVYPSLFEGFGIPLLEAMACGCPIVASRIPSTEEVALDCPYYFDATDPEGFAHALAAVLDAGRDPDRQARGFARARQYTWDAAARRTLKVYGEALGFRSGSRALVSGSR
jgi:glycosyltransferase involved in cell wall biosynthesis